MRNGTVPPVILTAVAIGAFMPIGCERANSITAADLEHITPAPSRTPTVTPTPRPPVHANGTTTWVSISASRALCPEITSQVGSTDPLWLTMQTSGSSVTLTLGEDPPSDDPLGELPSRWVGTLTGNSIWAEFRGPYGGFACPNDDAITPRTGGTLTATNSAGAISGEYTEIYGRDSNAVTLLFRFRAAL